METAVFFRLVTFRVAGPVEGRAALETIGAVAGVSVRATSARPLGIMERPALFVPLHEVRAVLEIEAPSVLGVGARDPYRFHDPASVRDLSVALADVLDELDAEERVITEGLLAFETRRYEPALCDGLLDELTRGASPLAVHVDAEIRREGAAARLHARLRGAPAAVTRLARLVRRSGLVDVDRIRLEFG